MSRKNLIIHIGSTGLQPVLILLFYLLSYYEKMRNNEKMRMRARFGQKYQKP